MAAAWPDPPELLVFPESALTGYFLEGGVQELALPAERFFEDLTRIIRRAAPRRSTSPSASTRCGSNHLHNSALYASLGGSDAGIRHVHRKVFLPTYGVFDEERFVEPGRSVSAFDTRWGRCAMLVCEDAWHSLAPTLAALDGAQVVLIPSATPGRGLTPRLGFSRPANLDRWDRLAQGIAEEHGVYVIVSQLVGFEGGKGFAGGSIAAGPRGTILLQAPLFEPATVPVDIYFEEITRARAEAPLLSDLQARLPHSAGELVGSAAWRLEGASRTTPERPNRPGLAPRRRAAEPPSRRPRHRSGAHPQVAGRVHQGRDPPPPPILQGRDRSLGRCGQRAGDVSGDRGPGPRERHRGADAVSDLECRRVSTTRNW